MIRDPEGLDNRKWSFGMGCQQSQEERWRICMPPVVANEELEVEESEARE